jgi:hypothetical protein
MLQSGKSWRTQEKVVQTLFAKVWKADIKRNVRRGFFVQLGHSSCTLLYQSRNTTYSRGIKILCLTLHRFLSAPWKCLVKLPRSRFSEIPVQDIQAIMKKTRIVQ